MIDIYRARPKTKYGSAVRLTTVKIMCKLIIRYLFNSI